MTTSVDSSTTYVQAEEEYELPEAAVSEINARVKELSARKLMGLALIQSGASIKDVKTICLLTGPQTKELYAFHEAEGLDKYTAGMVKNWENILRAKLMRVTECALDSIHSNLTNGDTRSAKDAASVLDTVFDKYRLSTGQSTENTSTSIQKLTEAISSRRNNFAPNSSASSVAPIDLEAFSPNKAVSDDN